MNSAELVKTITPYLDVMLKVNYIDAVVINDKTLDNVIYIKFPDGKTFELVVWNMTPER